MACGLSHEHFSVLKQTQLSLESSSRSFAHTARQDARNSVFTKNKDVFYQVPKNVFWGGKTAPMTAPISSRTVKEQFVWSYTKWPPLKKQFVHEVVAKTGRSSCLSALGSKEKNVVKVINP